MRDRRLLSEVDAAARGCPSVAEWDAELGYVPPRTEDGFLARGVADIQIAVFGGVSLAAGEAAVEVMGGGRGRGRGKFRHSISDLGPSLGGSVIRKGVEEEPDGAGGGCCGEKGPRGATAATAVGSAVGNSGACQVGVAGIAVKSQATKKNLAECVGAAGLGGGMGLGKVGAALWMVVGGACAFGASYVLRSGS